VTEVLAVDIGGTKFAVGLVRHDGEILRSLSASTPASHDPEMLFAVLRELIDRLDAGAAISVGVGCGGPMAFGGEHVSPLNIPGWREFPLRARLAALTGKPTFVDNDAKALALGEGWLGAARGARNYVGMVVSTGVGGGIVCDGRALDGTAGNAGHIGHITVEPDGHLCECGARGCLEAEASGTAIARITGREARDADAATIERCGRLVGRGIAAVANLLDLQLAVVAGSVALGFGEPFFAAAQYEIDERCRLDFSRGTRVVPAGLGSAAPLIGAARVAQLRQAL
jgi:glucokinase